LAAERERRPIVNDWLRVAEPVADAIARRRPVVALETTLVTHGLPRPEGLRTALELEQAVRERGAVPATIGLLDGAVRVGLSANELERLAAPPTPDKINLSNLAAHLSRGARGSTTVAATMLGAHRAGIAVLATGGIGGVHRGVAESGDVSADLVALSRLPVAVVCSGAKAILDLPRTVEMLETLGVPVLGFGIDELPAFYRRRSGLPIDARYDDVVTLAAAIETHFLLGAGTGVVVANPIPAESELAADLDDRAMAAARAAADAAGVRGRALTPFLLEHLRAATGGASVAANRALLVANARLAGDLAVALAARR
jgi:pseudouridine-5'-phosphate glycosidase